MQLSPLFEGKVSDAFIDTIELAAPICDIGNIGIPMEILRKKTGLTEEEEAVRKTHTDIGAKFLTDLYVSSDYNDFVVTSVDIIRHHHENWDGSGYPQGLKMNEMKESDHFAQIIAIADVYDAMTAKRAHRAALCPFHVIADFEIEGLQKYNPKYILTFLERIAYTYQSNRVMLTDGRYAKILMLNRQFLSRPIVEVEDGIVELSRTPDIRIQTLL